MQKTDRTAPVATSSWHLRLPYLALGLFLVLLGMLVWLTHRHDVESQRTTLISDVLWMEQNLQFHLDRNAAQLAQIGHELVAPQISPQTDAKLKQLLRAESGMVRIVWLDGNGDILGAQPPLSDDHLIGEALGTVPARSIFRLARSIGRPVYGPAYEIAGGGHHFEVHVPAYSDTGLLGVTVGIYSLQDLVARELPWWFSERYHVSVLDPDGREIAAKSRVAPLSDQHTYTMAFDPPGHGLLVRISAYKGDVRWVPALLIASIVLLGGIIVWSIWQLRRQLLRRQAAEQALRGETAFRKAMEDSLVTGLRARDLEGRITYVNPAFCRIVGYSADELIGHLPPMPYWDPDHIDRTQEVHDQILSGHAPPEGVELRLRRKDGEQIDTMIFEAPLIDAEGRHTGWMGSMLDITEQKRARELARQQDERLQATSRLITMGEMASTLAHELNQPLAAITSYNNGCLNLLADGNADSRELLEIHERLARQARRAGEIIRRVHDFVRRSEPKREPLDLNDVIRDAVGLLEADSRKRRVRIQTDLGTRLPEVAADPVMIEQVIVNLVRNGMDAMNDTPRERKCVRISTREEGGHLIVRVADQGTGVPPETARRLFEPFFSTKQEGMGMGLNICRSIAELHHGRLGFEANPDGGTIFILTLPVEQEPS
ncbi:MAG TPA: PAS domain S-box protein [Rhodocyclaceae bacterium]|nr:PAS domain S-box protein [Rhodocyclaceae bacterium]